MTTVQKQSILVYFDCLPPEGIDGIWGPRSAEATAQLQRKIDIPDDGIWGPETEAAVAAHLMGWEQVRRLPVTQNGRLCGMIGLSDLAGREENIMDAADALADITANISSAF